MTVTPPAGLELQPGNSYLLVNQNFSGSTDSCAASVPVNAQLAYSGAITVKGHDDTAETDPYSGPPAEFHSPCS